MCDMCSTLDEFVERRDKIIAELRDGLFNSKLTKSKELPSSGRIIPFGAFDLHVTGTVGEWEIDGLQIGEFYRPICSGEDLPLRHVARKYIEHFLNTEVDNAD